ncbi:MAG: TauD/TfdA dioxygenase family protein [Pseudomonadales bacterium]
MKIQQTGSAVGAVVSDINLATISDTDFDLLHRAFEDHGVLFFHDQQLTPEQHIGFAQRFGPINVNRFFHPVDGHPQIAEVLKEPDQTVNIGGGWHTDHSYDVEPARCSVLYAREVPAFGGDTLFAGMGAAYDALSPDFQKMLLSLEAVHSSRHVFGADAAGKREVGDRFGNAEAATQDAVHPVVIAHPDTGRKLLYVNPGFTIGIKGWNAEESDNLLQFLYRHAMKPEFHSRFSWRQGSLAMWDNRATWHYALNDYQGQRRYMHRITIEGGALRAAA